jgi:hypothetical protein
MSSNEVSTKEGIMNIYEFMHSLPVDGVECGIDALTITSTGLDGKLSIDLVLHSLARYIEAQQVKPFRFQGAEGKAWGSVRYAVKWGSLQQQHWAILMVTGEQSPGAFKESLKVKDVNYTRIDLCIDVFMRERVLGLPRKLKDTYKGGETSIKLIERLTGDTLYCGSRESESMIRIYDKSPEYDEELGRVWRFEVEYKKSLARLAAEVVEREGAVGIADIVWSELRKKDLPSPVIPNKVNVGRRMATLSSAEMKVSWLSRQVGPTVEWLKKLGLESEVRGALQLPLVIDNT